MLLTLTTTHQPATDLGFLLHKHPDRHHTVGLPFGTAHVFYPEAGEARCTAALVVDIDPAAIGRGRPGSRGTGSLLDDPVNDRPYAASSLLAVAMRRAYASAIAGHAEDRPELVDLPLPLEARLAPLRCRDGIAPVRALFEPLGYALAATPIGTGLYQDVTIAGLVPLKRLLAHLYVLIPVLDDDRHRGVGDDEVETLARHGDGWLALHPERALITRRYLDHRGGPARTPIAQLEALDAGALPVEPEERADPALRDLCLERVAAEIAASGARSVLDLGCGSGMLSALLLENPQFERIVGLDASSRSLARAADRLRLDDMSEARRRRITLLHGALTYRDRRLAGFDAAALVDVVEHIDPPRLDAFADVVFGAARPRTVVLTTPNADDHARHADRRPAWSRIAFRTWAEQVATRYGYAVRHEGIGEADLLLGAPTQMGVFTWS